MKTETELLVQQISLYDKVTNKIITMIEKGVVPWKKPWSTYGLARNYVSGRLYTGINYLLMNNTNYPIPYFLTFNQIKELGGNLKKGSEAEMLIYFKVYCKDSNDNTLTPEEAKQRRLKGENIKVLRFIRYYNVFNLEDIEEVELNLNRFNEAKLTENERNERCEHIIRNMRKPPELRQIDSNRAYYHPAMDYINMPDIKQFENPEYYYATYFHELIHSTGHSSRLARDKVMDFSGFGSKTYSKEELVAEMGASMLLSQCQIDHDSLVQNSASYLVGWLKVLKEDSKFIFKVFAEAQKAVEFILTSSREQTG